MFGAAVAACSGRHDASGARPVDDVLVTGAAASDYYCAPDPKVADRIAATLAQSDEDAYRDAIYSALPVQPGTRVTVLQRTGGDRPMVRVRVETGVYRGDSCWYPASAKGLLSRAR